MISTRRAIILGLAAAMITASPTGAAEPKTGDSKAGNSSSGSSSSAPGALKVPTFQTIITYPDKLIYKSDKKPDVEKTEAPAPSAPSAPPVRFTQQPPISTAFSIEDARFNFGTVVKNFIAENSSQGVWRVENPEIEEELALKLRAIDNSSIEQSGRGAYTGRVLMRKPGSRRDTPVNFTVDFSGDDWKVLKYDVLQEEAPESLESDTLPASNASKPKP